MWPILLQTRQISVVCLSVTTLSPAKTAEPIVMPFGMWIPVGPRNDVLDGVQILAHEEAILRAKRIGPGHARTCSAVDVLKATQQGAASVRCWLKQWFHVVMKLF